MSTNIIKNDENKIDPDLRYIVDRLAELTSAEGEIQGHFNSMCALYHRYLNSDTKAKRLELLTFFANEVRQMIRLANDVLVKSNRTIPSKVVREINHLCKPRLANYYLNAHQIYQFYTYCGAVEAELANAGCRPKLTTQELYELKMKHMTAFYLVLLDLEEVALLTNAEPEYEVQS